MNGRERDIFDHEVDQGRWESEGGAVRPLVESGVIVRTTPLEKTVKPIVPASDNPDHGQR